MTITRSSIHSNHDADYDLYTQYYDDPSLIIWAPDNWWGTTDLEQVADRIYDQEDPGSATPHVWFGPFGSDCEPVVAGDADGDGRPDSLDNCSYFSNQNQADGDGDGMGDPCDDHPGVAPSEPCDGSSDVADGYNDPDGDGIFAVGELAEMVYPSEWIPLAVGEHEPAFDTGTQAGSVLNELMELYNEINEGVLEGEDDASVGQWSRGFIRGHS